MQNGSQPVHFSNLAPLGAGLFHYLSMVLQGATQPNRGGHPTPRPTMAGFSFYDRGPPGAGDPQMCDSSLPPLMVSRCVVASPACTNPCNISNEKPRAIMVDSDTPRGEAAINCRAACCFSVIDMRVSADFRCNLDEVQSPR
jgi:hypothetical protein